MSISLLATKLYIPPSRSTLVVRLRLIERLNEGLRHKLTLISAPAGFGKTTLVSEWVADCERPAAWLSLDEGDSDLVRWLTYVVGALQTIAPALGSSVVSKLESPVRSDTEALLTALLNELAAIPEPFVLVLDDYHVIESAPVDQALTFLLEHLPPQMHVVITTREDPALPLARFRARGQLTELRAADLRFTPSEAASFLNQGMGLNLSAEDVAALETRTEGWIAGLQLAAISMHGQPDTTRFIQSFTGSHHFVIDYLVEEVLHQQPEAIQTFLLRTSVLDRLCGPLCDAVLLNPAVSGQQTLETIEHANLFLVPLDNERRWYRYHHLFADLLRQRLHLGSTAGPGDGRVDVAELHRRASVWYAEHHFTADAIRHALAARDFVLAAGLIELAWPEMDGRFQSVDWLAWAREIPDELIRVRPVLSVAYAWALLNGGEMGSVETRLQDAENRLDSSTHDGVEIVITDEAQFRKLPASISTARAFRTLALGDIAGSVTHGRQALDLLPESDHLRRGPAASLLALAQWASGDLEAAYQTLAEAMANFQKIGSVHFAISGTYGLADIRVAQGRLRDAIRIYTDMLELALAQGDSLIRGTANLYLGLSELHHERGDAEAAVQNLLSCEALGEQALLQNSLSRLYQAKALFRQSSGDLAGALDLLDEAERVFQRTPVPDVRPLAALKARVWVAQGRLSEAPRWVQDQGLSVDDELSFLRETEHITLARVLLAESLDSADAMTLLNRLLQAAESGQRMGSAIEIGVLLALAHQAQGHAGPALAALERALTLAEPEGYVRIFVDEGPAMARLLSEAAARGIVPDYTARLLAVFAADQQGDTPSAPHSPTQALDEPLSERELEILRLIAQGFSNREIGEQLFLALDTIKGHNSRIFGKLAVQRRTEAVARAHELGLL